MADNTKIKIITSSELLENGTGAESSVISQTKALQQSGV